MEGKWDRFVVTVKLATKNTLTQAFVDLIGRAGGLSQSNCMKRRTVCTNSRVDGR